MMDEIRRMAERIEPGLARRWIRRNWAKALYAAGWAALGILIRESVAATRPEHWHMGSEIIPAVLCWTMAIRCALGEDGAKKRKAEGRKNAADDILRQQRGV